ASTIANSLFREGTALIDQILLETLTPIGREGWPTSVGDLCSIFLGLPISRSRLPGPGRSATKCRKERRASWGGTGLPEAANWGHVHSSSMWRRGGNQAQWLAFGAVW